MALTATGARGASGLMSRRSAPSRGTVSPLRAAAASAAISVVTAQAPLQLPQGGDEEEGAGGDTTDEEPKRVMSTLV